MNSRELKAHELYIGRVVDIDNTTQTVKVKLNNGIVAETLSCVYAGGIMSSLLGFNSTFLPEKSTRVIVLYTSTELSYIIGCLPDVASIPHGLNRKSVNGVSTAANSNNEYNNKDLNPAQNYCGHRPNIDLLEGELEIGNIKGVALSLLQNLAKLQAGALAKVECHLLDDMVRIISDKFKHHSAFGDYEIFNDSGKLNVRWLGTNADHEAWDNSLPISKKTDTDGSDNIDETTENPWMDTGRWRFHSYIGHLGDFINLFVSDPIGNITKLVDNLTHNSGRFRTHVNEDGGFLLQSVSDIILERVVRIPVPIEKKRYEDPTEATEAGILGSPPFEQWIPSDIRNIFEATYQLRDYARWYSNFYSLAAFHLDSDHYIVPSESQINLPLPNNANPTKAGMDPLFAQYYYKYATIRIFRDGSILLMDADGSAVNMSNKDVTISAARNLNLEAANHITFTAGNDVYINARRHIELTALVGGFLLRAKSWLQLLCESGTLLLESRAKKGAIEQAIITPRIIDNSGVVIKSDAADLSFSGIDFKFFSRLGSFLCKCVNVQILTSKLFKINNTVSIDRKDLKVIGSVTAASGKFNNGIEGWGHVPTGSPTAVPLQPLLTFPLVANSYASALTELNLPNEALVLEPILTGFRYQQLSYDKPTLYESVTQQHLRLNPLDITYSDLADIQWKLTSSSGISTPFPGNSIGRLGYQPINQDALDAAVINPLQSITATNKANIFIPITNFKYYNTTTQQQ